MALLTSSLSSKATNTSTYNPVNSAFTGTVTVSGQLNGFNGSLSGSSYAFSGTFSYSVTGAAGSTLTAGVDQLVLTLPYAGGSNVAYGTLKSTSVYYPGASAADIIVGFSAPLNNTTIGISANRVAATLPATNGYVNQIDVPYTVTNTDTALGANNINFRTVGDFLRLWNLNG
jgi:hypothetical protein